METKKIHKSEDRRVKRTKKILREKLFELLEEKPLEEITVKELSAAADVNRSTFYFYYDDINDMLEQIQNEIFMVFERDVLDNAASFVTVDDFADYCTRFLEFCKQNEEICKFVISNDPNNKLAKKIKSALMQEIPDTKKVFSLSDPKCYLTTFALAGIWQTVLDWMYDGMKIPPREMAQFLSKVYFFGGRTYLSL